MSGKRNVSVCRGHELANALYNLVGTVLHSVFHVFISIGKSKYSVFFMLRNARNKVSLPGLDSINFLLLSI